MPRDGSGNYIRPAGQPVTTGTVIDATVFNTLTADLATALTGSMPRDGQAPPTANLPMGNFKLTGLGNGSASTDSITYGQAQSLDSAVAATAQSGSAQWLTSVSGTNTITGNASPAITAYAAGQIFRFVPAGANTGAVTLQINGVGTAQSVTKNGTLPLVTGDILAGSIVTVVYDGTRFQLLKSDRRGVVQRVEAAPYTTWATTTNQIPYDDTIPQNTEGTEYLTATITPTRSTNRLVIETVLPISSTGAVTVVAALFQDSAANALAATAVTPPTQDYMYNLVLRHEMAAGTTSATTFRIRAGRGGVTGSIVLNGSTAERKFGGTIACRLSVTEIEP